MVMGDPLDEKTDIGAIISDDQFDKVKTFIDEGLATSGATGRACSAMPDDPALKKGLFIRPYIFTNLAQREPAGAGGDLRARHRGHSRSTTTVTGRWPTPTTANTAWPPRSGPTT